MTMTALNRYDTGVITHHLEDDNMFDNTHWFWFVLGFVPYSTERKVTRCGRDLEIHALFWTLTVSRRVYRHKRRRWTRTHWRLRLPFVEKLRRAVWAAVLSLRK